MFQLRCSALEEMVARFNSEKMNKQFMLSASEQKDLMSAWTSTSASSFLFLDISHGENHLTIQPMNRKLSFQKFFKLVSRTHGSREVCILVWSEYGPLDLPDIPDTGWYELWHFIKYSTSDSRSVIWLEIINVLTMPSDVEDGENYALNIHGGTIQRTPVVNSFGHCENHRLQLASEPAIFLQE